jgi:ubiquinone biosynthesis protein COQ4
MFAPLRRYDVPRAGRALKALLEDPDDLPQVFTLVEALRGAAPFRLEKGFADTEAGRALVAQQADILPLLTDRDALRALPAGSLGRAYLDFVEREHISAEGLRAAARAGEGEGGEVRFRWQRARMRDTHDLWHVVTGYQGDVLGELSLLAFFLAQTWHPGIALVLAGGFAKGLWGHDGWLVVDAFARGKRAAWLPAQPWEELLAQPLEAVRVQLGLGAPPLYQPLRSSELRARGVVGPAKAA